MKFLVLIAVILAVIWYLRGERAARHGATSARQHKPPPRSLPTQDMVACPVCGVHLPRSDALPGPGGDVHYCCEEHRSRADAGPRARRAG